MRKASSSEVGAPISRQTYRVDFTNYISRGVSGGLLGNSMKFGVAGTEYGGEGAWEQTPREYTFFYGMPTS